MDAPPSRYRVIERDGRLVVIDTVAGGTPPRAKDLLPDQNECPRAGGDPEVQATSFLTLDSRFRGNTDEAATPAPPRPSFLQSPVATPPGLLRNVAATVCSDARDGDGRLQWTTARWFDAKGPRTVALSADAEPQLGFATLALLAAAFCAVIVVVAFGFAGFIVLIVIGTALSKAKLAVTAWIDSLDAS